MIRSWLLLKLLFLQLFVCIKECYATLCPQGLGPSVQSSFHLWGCYVSFRAQKKREKDTKRQLSSAARLTRVSRATAYYCHWSHTKLAAVWVVHAHSLVTDDTVTCNESFLLGRNRMCFAPARHVKPQLRRKNRTNTWRNWRQNVWESVGAKKSSQRSVNRALLNLALGCDYWFGLAPPTFQGAGLLFEMRIYRSCQESDAIVCKLLFSNVFVNYQSIIWTNNVSSRIWRGHETKPIASSLKNWIKMIKV